jgi:hypothetical protein
MRLTDPCDSEGGADLVARGQDGGAPAAQGTDDRESVGRAKVGQSEHPLLQNSILEEPAARDARQAA